MKDYLKNEIKHLPFVLIVFVLLYGIVTIATSYQYDSGDIRFDNTGTDLESVNVQDALDETFHHLTDYNEIKTTIGNSTLTTTSQTLTGAVNELKTDVGALNNSIASINTKVNTLYDSQTMSFTNVVTGAGSIVGHRVGKVAQVLFSKEYNATTASGWATVCTVPTTCRPKAETKFVVYSGSQKVRAAKIDTSGNVQVYGATKYEIYEGMVFYLVS